MDDEFQFITTNFVDQTFTPLFSGINIQDIKIVAYTDIHLSNAIENGLNWYLSTHDPKSYIDNQFPIDLMDEEIDNIQNNYKINICIIENDSKMEKEKSELLL